jgi:hypothetical protein
MNIQKKVKRMSDKMYKPVGSEHYVADDLEKELGWSNRDIAVNHIRIAKQIIANMEIPSGIFTVRPWAFEFAELHIRIAEFHINLARHDEKR